MPRTPQVSVEGQEMDIPVEKAEEMPINCFVQRG
jgi:hypothetical protein